MFKIGDKLVLVDEFARKEAKSYGVPLTDIYVCSYIKGNGRGLRVEVPDIRFKFHAMPEWFKLAERKRPVLEPDNV